jgi:argonaute-like protein implicated in RNA metabolism and viral defense
LVGIKVRTDGSNPRLFRMGNMPVLRGTFWRLGDSAGLLWGSGFKPRIGTYDGWEIPLPMRIDVQHGEAPIERVAQDIFGLTKLNYNACRLGDSDPVTIKFSDAVGEILVSNPAVTSRRPQFRFYI